MKEYIIVFKTEAEQDKTLLYRYIAYVLHAPDTAINYINGIRTKAITLSYIGACQAVSKNTRLRALYGDTVRTARYNKMSIIYTVSDDFIMIKRVIAGSMVYER